MARPRSTVKAPAAPTGLALHEAAARAQLLLRERARLLREVQKKKLLLTQAREKSAFDSREAVTRISPLMQRHRQLIRELTATFAELLSEGRLAARARKQVEKLRRSLELRGVLPPLDGCEDDDEPNGDDAFDEQHNHDQERARRAPRSGEQRQRQRQSQSTTHEPQVESAKQVGQTRRSLRELFRNLARAIHPDQARHEADRLQRTELMKELTRAYEDGDLARLIELEAAWQGEQALAETGDAVARCHELERSNRELLKQVRQLTRELRDAKREAREQSRGLPPHELIERASFELDALAALCSWLERFRDGKMTLSELQQRCS